MRSSKSSLASVGYMRPCPKHTNKRKERSATYTGVHPHLRPLPPNSLPSPSTSHSSELLSTFATFSLRHKQTTKNSEHLKTVCHTHKGETETVYKTRVHTHLHTLINNKNYKALKHIKINKIEKQNYYIHSQRQKRSDTSVN